VLLQSCYRVLQRSTEFDKVRQSSTVFTEFYRVVIELLQSSTEFDKVLKLLQSSQSSTEFDKFYSFYRVRQSSTKFAVVTELYKVLQSCLLGSDRIKDRGCCVFNAALTSTKLKK
jgi:hypothetical protein